MNYKFNLHVFAPFLPDSGIVAVHWRAFYTVPVLIRFCLPPQDTSNRRRLIKQSALEHESRAWPSYGFSRSDCVFAGTRILSGSVSPYDPRGMIILSFLDIIPSQGSISSEPDTNSGVFGGSVTASRPTQFWHRSAIIRFCSGVNVFRYPCTRPLHRL